MAVSRVARMVAVLGAVTAATLGVSALASAGTGHHKPSASELVDRDPGKRVGGNTTVLTGNGGHALGVHDRPNFIISLGSNEKIVGGGTNDELGALGQHDTIVAGHGGHALIHDGPHGTIVVGGSGHDLVIANKPDTTIDVESPGDKIVASGHDDHIVCSGDSFHDVIYVNHSDTVNKTCHKHHDPVRPDRQSELARDFSPPTAHAAATMIGSGIDADPYTAPCTRYEDPSGCAVWFASRSLTGFWANEHVPAYKCPTLKRGGSEEPWLKNISYAPFATNLPYGVQVVETDPWPIGVSINDVSTTPSFTTINLYGTGTLTENSSATNWTFGTASYTVVLHCTNNPRDAWSIGVPAG